MDLVIITGQSGAGKTKAAAFLEDLGYYCVDNLPPIMLLDLLSNLKKDKSIEKVAVVCDIRSRKFFDELERSLNNLKLKGFDFKILFLEAREDVLLKRFQEVRRNHPLSKDGDDEGAIKNEILQLHKIKEKADIVIDTSEFKTANLNYELLKHFGNLTEKNFELNIQSFGYKYGIPLESDWVIDVRFIPNPFYVASLKNLTGKNKKVKDFVLSFDETKKFLDNLGNEIIRLIPKYIREGKYHLNISIGCTGGKHRSVVIADALCRMLKDNGYDPKLKHRMLK